MFVNVSVYDFAKLMDYVKPEYGFTCHYYEDSVEIEFEVEDGVKAEKWVYSNYNFHIYTNYNGCIGCYANIFYDKETDSFGWSCDIDNSMKVGYTNPDEAETAVNDYIEALK